MRQSLAYPPGSVLADAEFDSERHHQHIRETVGATSIILAKRGKSTWRIHGIRAQMRASFPATQHAQRALVESIFSAVKRKLSARAPGRSLGLTYNPYRLKPCVRHRLLTHALPTAPS